MAKLKKGEICPKCNSPARADINIGICGACFHKHNLQHQKNVLYNIAQYIEAPRVTRSIK